MDHKVDTLVITAMFEFGALGLIGAKLSPMQAMFMFSWKACRGLARKVDRGMLD